MKNKIKLNFSLFNFYQNKIIEVINTFDTGLQRTYIKPKILCIYCLDVNILNITRLINRQNPDFVWLLNINAKVNKAIGYNIYNHNGNTLMIKIDLNRYKDVDLVEDGYLFDNILFSCTDRRTNYSNCIGIMNSEDIIESNDQFENIGLKFNSSHISQFGYEKKLLFIRCNLQENFMINNTINYYVLDKYMNNCMENNFQKIKLYKNNNRNIIFNKKSNAINSNLIDEKEIITKFGKIKKFTDNKNKSGEIVTNNIIKETKSFVYDICNIPAKPIIEKMNEIDDIIKKNLIIKGIKLISKSLIKIIFMKKNKVFDLIKNYPIDINKVRPISIVPAYFKVVENSFEALHNDLINNTENFVYSYMPGHSIDKVFEKIFNSFQIIDNG